MLLRSISKHIKDQNWFAVFVDFFIVVFGVFIGLQVNNWNEARQDKLALDQSMVRLVDEMHANLKNSQAGYDSFAPKLKIIQLAINDLRNCDESEEALARVNLALNEKIEVYAIEWQFEAIDKLLSASSLLSQLPQEEQLELSEVSRIMKQQARYIEMVGDQMNDAFGSSGYLHNGPFIAREDMQVHDMSKYPDASQSQNYYRVVKLRETMGKACTYHELMSGFYEWEDSTINMMFQTLRSQKFIKEWLDGLGVPLENKF